MSFASYQQWSDYQCLVLGDNKRKRPAPPFYPGLARVDYAPSKDQYHQVCLNAETKDSQAKLEVDRGTTA